MSRVQDEVLFMTWKNVVIANWHTATTTQGIAALEGEVAKACEATTEMVGLLQVIGTKSSPPDAAARQALSAVFQRHQARIACNTVLVEGGGFLAASVRAVVTGLAMVSRLSFPLEVYSTPAEAAKGTLRHLGLDPAQDRELVHAIQSLQREAEPTELQGS